MMCENDVDNIPVFSVARANKVYDEIYENTLSKGHSEKYARLLARAFSGIDKSESTIQNEVAKTK